MNNIFMCVNYPIYNMAIGISKKIEDQIETFQKMGFSVSYSVYLTDGVGVMTDGKLVYKKQYPKYIPHKLHDGLRHFFLLQISAEYLEGKSYMLGYIRWDAMDIQFMRVLSKLKKICQYVVMDCHGYFPEMKRKTLKGKYILWTTNVNKFKMHKYVDLMLTESHNKMIFSVPAMTIDTGINVDKYNPNVYTGHINEVHMISVANETTYHGYDRIIKGIYEYQKNNTTGINVYLHLVGNMSCQTYDLVTKYNLQQNVFLYGYKTGEELKKIYSQCNIGVGPLAPHRIGGKQGTGIKTKEFFAIGLPYFYAGQELLVPDDYPYVYKINADEKSVDINEIVTFYHLIKNDEHKQEKMREFANENFSWEKIYKKMLNIIMQN